MAWPLTFLYTQVVIVNNTKLSSPGEGKWPLKLAVIKIKPRLSFQTWSSRQLCRWKDARSETADIFFEDIATVWNGVRQALLCLIITCLCMLSFLLNDFSQTEQNQLMPASQEQSVDREKGRMLRIYIGLLLVLPSFTTTTFLLFSFSITTITFLLFSFSTATTFLYFLPPPRTTTTFLLFSSFTTSAKFLFFPFKSFYKRPYFTTISSVCSNVWSCQDQPWFSSTVSCLFSSSAPVSLTDSHSTTTTCISPSLIQLPKEYILLPEENKWKVF